MHPHVTVPLQDTPTKDQSSVHVESDAELHFSSKGFKDSRILIRIMLGIRKDNEGKCTHSGKWF